jgi:hypothetical protein
MTDIKKAIDDLDLEVYEPLGGEFAQVRIFLENKTFCGRYMNLVDPIISIVQANRKDYVRADIINYYTTKKTFEELYKYLVSIGFIHYIDIYKKINEMFQSRGVECSLCGKGLVSIMTLANRVFELNRDLIDFVMENPKKIDRPICCSCYAKLVFKGELSF